MLIWSRYMYQCTVSILSRIPIVRNLVQNFALHFLERCLGTHTVILSKVKQKVERETCSHQIILPTPTQSYIVLENQTLGSVRDASPAAKTLIRLCIIGYTHRISYRIYSTVYTFDDAASYPHFYGIRKIQPLIILFRWERITINRTSQTTSSPVFYFSRCFFSRLSSSTDRKTDALNPKSVPNWSDFSIAVYTHSHTQNISTLSTYYEIDFEGRERPQRNCKYSDGFNVLYKYTSRHVRNDSIFFF